MLLAKIKMIAIGFSKKGTNKMQKTVAKTEIKNTLKTMDNEIENKRELFSKKPKKTPLNKNI